MWADAKLAEVVLVHEGVTDQEINKKVLDMTEFTSATK